MSNLAPLPQPTQTQSTIAIPTQPPLETPSAWMQTGTSPAEIILACTYLIWSIAGLIQVLKANPK